MTNTPLLENPYVRDILDQPHAVRLGLEKLDLSRLEPLGAALRRGDYDRIVLTGMGASIYALYPAWLHLAAAGYPAIWADAAELVHGASNLVGPKTLLVIASQSGRSAEVVALLAQTAAQGRAPAALIAISNTLDSSLAQAAARMQAANPGSGVLLPLNAAPEDTPSTRTYLLTLAIAQLAAKSLAGDDLGRHRADLERTLAGIEAYLRDWETCMGQIGAALAGVDERAPAPSIVLLGRGLSYASVLGGALNLQEAAKIPALGLQSAEFRHGPLEIAGRGISALVFSGATEVEQALNRKLCAELRDREVNAWMLSTDSTDLLMPAAAGIGLPLAEIIPVQLLCVYLALKAGRVPGAFRHIGKITEEE